MVLGEGIWCPLRARPLQGLNPRSGVRSREGYYAHPPWRQPRGKWVVSLVNSHTNATGIGWHLWEIGLRFAPGWEGDLGTAGRERRLGAVHRMRAPRRASPAKSLKSGLYCASFLGRQRRIRLSARADRASCRGGFEPSGRGAPHARAAPRQPCQESQIRPTALPRPSNQTTSPAMSLKSGLERAPFLGWQRLCQGGQNMLRGRV